MKNLFTLGKFICIFVFFCITVFSTAQNMQQVNNAGFEQWEGTGLYVEPVDWSSFMNTECSNAYYLSVLLHKQIDESSNVRPGTTGTKSARIYARDTTILFYSIVANGNLTTGRIYAQELDLSQAGNKTKREETGFNHPFTAQPDSMTFWVKNNCASTTQTAYVTAVIHNNTDYFVPLSGINDYENAVAVAISTFTNEGNTWIRKSAPFDYDSYQSNDPQYLLMFCNTNTEVGEGSGSDEMFMDDILLIYNPSVSVNTITPTIYNLDNTTSAAISIPFTLTGTMSPGNLNASPNVVTAQLSDATGNFSNPISLGSIATNESGSISGTIPAGTPPGTGYRVRVVTTNYPMISEDNGENLTIIYPSYNVTVSANPSEGGTVEGGGTFNYGETATVTATATTGYDFVNWVFNGNQVSTNASYMFTVTENMNLIANFSQVGSYVVTVSTNPSGAGTITGAGSYLDGTEVTVSTTPNLGFTFLHWEQNGIQVSTNLSYTFTISENTNMVALYQHNSYNISLTADPIIGGTVLGGGVFNYGTQITIEATPAANYHFKGWVSDNDTISYNLSYTFTVVEDLQIVGHFALNNSISEINIDKLHVYSVYQNIIVDVDKYGEICIYNIMGQLVNRATVVEGKNMFSVQQSGLYFVRMNGVSVKVMVAF